MTELEERIRKIYEEADDWGPATDRRVQLAIGLSLTPTERLRWLETMQESFARWHGLIPADAEEIGESGHAETEGEEDAAREAIRSEIGEVK